jgi:outer membrane receptor for ferrienterochelin and colicins
MKYLKYTVISFFLISGIQTFSQTNCDWSTLDDADQTYQTGNFEETIKIINNCINSGFNDQQKVQGYRLLAKTYIALDNDSNTNTAVNELLLIDPKFQPDYLSDPPKFIKIIEAVKKLKSSLIVTSVSKKEENIYETPATAFLITEKQLKNRGYLDLEAVLHDLPGFDISRSNGNLYTHAYQRGYRSINTNRTLFLIDGVEENDLWSSNVYLSRQYALSNIKNIEVIYGPASTMYGSNAFLGVINVITKEPSDFIQAGKSVGFDIRAGYGSYNTKFVDGTFAMRSKNNNVAFSITGRMFLSDEQDLSSYEQHDFELHSLNDHADLYHNALDITDSETANGFVTAFPTSHEYYYSENLGTDNARIILTDEGIQAAIDFNNQLYQDISFKDKTEAYTLDAKLKVYDFLIGWSGWKKSEGTGAQYNDLVYLSVDEGGNWKPVHNYFYIKYDKDLNSRLNISNFLRYKIHDFDVNNGVVPTANYLSGDFDLGALYYGVYPLKINVLLFQKSNQLREEFKVLYQPLDRIDIVAGFEARFSAIQGNYTNSVLINSESAPDSIYPEEIAFPDTALLGGNHFFSRDLGLYAQAGIEITNNLNLTLGLRFDNNLVRQTEGYGNVFNPRIALVFKPGSFIIKGIYAEAFKDATNREKYSTSSPKREFSNPLLEPEKVKNYEFVVGKSFLDRKIFVNASVYFSQYSNIIQEVPVQKDDGTFTNQNQAVGEAEIYGVNAFTDLTFGNLTAYANYTFTQPYAIDPVDSDGNPQTDSLGNPYSRLRISDISKHKLNIGANYNLFDVVNINIRTNIIGKRPTGYNTTVSTNPETFDPVFVLNGAVSYSPRNWGLTLQLTAFNLLNTEYYSPGLDYATGDLASKLIQNKRNLYVSLIYEF